MKPQVKVYCPCKDDDALNSHTHSMSEGSSNPLDIIEDPNSLFPISNLLFCSTCESIRCRKCVEPEFLVNYCPSCLSFSNNEYNFCVRNCFVCPLCTANLTVSSTPVPMADKQDPRDTNVNKSFIFKCSSCPYKYNSGPLNKPKSLSSFIKSKVNNSKYHTQFSKLQQSHLVGADSGKQRQEPFRHEGRTDKPNFGELMQALQHIRISKKEKVDEDEENLRREIMIKVDEEADKNDAEALSKLQTNKGSILQLSRYLKTQARYSNESLSQTRLIKTLETDKNGNEENKPPKYIYQDILPVPKKLKSRKRLICKVCRNSLVEPYLEENKASFKFIKTSNAMDFLPSLEVIKFPKYKNAFQPNSLIKLLLIFKNPNLHEDINVIISTFDEVHSDRNIKVILPCNNFKITKLTSVFAKSKQDMEEVKIATDEAIWAKLALPEYFVKTVPTIKLNKATKISRIELLSRSADSSFWSKVNESNNNDSTNKDNKTTNSLNYMPPGAIGIPSANSPKKYMYRDMSKLNPLTSAPYVAANNLSKQSFSSSQESLQNFMSNSSGNNNANTEFTQASFIDSDEPLETGANWCCVPMNVVLPAKTTENYDLNIPLFLGVEIGDASFGYWTVAQLGKVVGR